MQWARNKHDADSQQRHGPIDRIGMTTTGRLKHSVAAWLKRSPLSSSNCHRIDSLSIEMKVTNGSKAISLLSSILLNPDISTTPVFGFSSIQNPTKHSPRGLQQRQHQPVLFSLSSNFINPEGDDQSNNNEDDLSKWERMYVEGE